MGEGPAMAGTRRRPKGRARYYAAIAVATVTGAALAAGATVASADAAQTTARSVTAPASPAGSWYVAPQTATPIKPLVVIFDENISFDHYFGTYPYAANTDGNPFRATPGTPKVNGLYRSINSKGPTGPLLTSNPNTGADGQPANPTRLTYSQALTCDQDHGYTAEQEAFNGGAMDKFVQFTNNSSCSPPNYSAPNLVKSAAYQDGHAGYSDPLDEQNFLVNTINAIEESPFWKSTAIVVTYDDSDGWYDHQVSTIVNGSNTSADAAICTPVATVLGTYPDRCGYGPRLPLLMISPYTRTNYVSDNLTDQSSVVKFIEDNWLGGQRIDRGSFDAIAGSLDAKHGVLDFKKPHFDPVILDPNTGEVVRS